MAAHSRRRFLRHAAMAASATCVAPGILARPGAPKGNLMKASEAMEDALALLAPTGPEYAGRLANHGPMAAEALVVLDRPDAVVPWVERYKKRLREHPGGTKPIDPKAWREALGEGDRVGDWIVFFRRQIEERPWKTVLAEWTARLSPGVVAAAFHGAIRTAHAVRSLEASETPARRRELAEGLGYWAATYNALPEAATSAKPPTGRRPSAAIAGVPLLPADRRVSYGNITDRLSPLDGFPPFASVADAVDPSGDAEDVSVGHDRDVRERLPRERRTPGTSSRSSTASRVRSPSAHSSRTSPRRNSAGCSATPGRPPPRSTPPPGARPARVFRRTPCPRSTT